MKKIILSCVAFVIAAASYAQQPQVDKAVAIKKQMVEFTEEYDLSSEQIDALKGFYKLDLMEAGAKISAADLQKKKASALESLKDVLPQALLTKLQATEKVALAPRVPKAKF